MNIIELSYFYQTCENDLIECLSNQYADEKYENIIFPITTQSDKSQYSRLIMSNWSKEIHVDDDNIDKNGETQFLQTIPN